MNNFSGRSHSYSFVVRDITLLLIRREGYHTFIHRGGIHVTLYVNNCMGKVILRMESSLNSMYYFLASYGYSFLECRTLQQQRKMSPFAKPGWSAKYITSARCVQLRKGLIIPVNFNFEAQFFSPNLISNATRILPTTKKNLTRDQLGVINWTRSIPIFNSMFLAFEILYNLKYFTGCSSRYIVGLCLVLEQQEGEGYGCCRCSWKKVVSSLLR